MSLRVLKLVLLQVGLEVTPVAPLFTVDVNRLG
jgi:hypothetical protein